MKFIYTITVLGAFLFSQTNFAQNIPQKQKYTAHNKGKYFISFGGNRGYYTNSDISFKGDNFNFTVANATAHDVPKGWHIDYINPTRLTIPQTNLRLGYFISDHYSIAIGVDHMKYVFSQNQTATVTGTINLPLSEPGSF
jgi:hypothetical protein